MAICTFCQGVNVNSIVVYIDDQDDSRSQWSYTHQPSYHALVASAKTCPLCDLFVHALGQINKPEDVAIALKQEDGRSIRLLASSEAFFDLRTPKALSHLEVMVDSSGKDIMEPANLDITAEPDDPLALSGDVTGRNVALRTTPAAILETARPWYDTCRRTHDVCQPTDGRSDADQRLPTRVIDIGSHPEATLSLRETKGGRGQYAVLSYCWGKSQAFTTTKETYEARCRGFSSSELPATIRDAVIATRAFGLQYLWIDAICIIQGDAQDWAVESARMADVYGNAAISISATSSPDTVAGLFKPRWTASKHPVVLKSACSSGKTTGTMNISLRLNSVEGALNNAVLNTRGWCLQERVLARRIVHFADDQLYWECQHHLATESGLTLPQEYSLKQSLRPSKSDAWRETVRKWHVIVEASSRRQLTYTSDKFPAISGCARILQQKIGSTYVAGLWKEDLPSALLWNVSGLSKVGTRPAPVWRAPSWSWASIDGPVNSQGHRMSVVTLASILHQAEVVSYDITAATKDDLGQLTAGSMHLRARKWRAKRATEPPGRDRVAVLLDDRQRRIGSVGFDDAFSGQPLEFDCVEIATGIRSKTENVIDSYFLVVKEHAERGCFTRLGAGSISSDYFEGQRVEEFIFV